MMKSKELRQRAWSSLNGKYGMAILVSLVTGILYSLGQNIASFASNLSEIVSAVDPSEMDSVMQIGALMISVVAIISAIIGLIIALCVGNVAYVGCCGYFIKNTDAKPTFGDAFASFKVGYGRNVGTMLLMSIKLVLWGLLFIIPGIIKSLEYAMIPYILADDAQITSKEAFARSKKMMTGNKWRLFKLNLSFIGWALLCIPTLGIGAIFLSPYIEAANAEFYVELKNR